MQALGVGVDPDRDQQMGRMSATAGTALDGAGVDFEARQIQPLDDAPNLARGMLLVDQASTSSGWSRIWLRSRGR